MFDRSYKSSNPVSIFLLFLFLLEFPNVSLVLIFAITENLMVQISLAIHHGVRPSYDGQIDGQVKLKGYRADTMPSLHTIRHRYKILFFYKEVFSSILFSVNYSEVLMLWRKI